MVNLHEIYPNSAHKKAAEFAVSYFQHLPETEAVLLVNPFAAGLSTADGNLDLVVLVDSELEQQHRERLHDSWLSFCRSNPPMIALIQPGYFDEVRLEIVDGRYTPTPRSFDSGVDNFELEIGRHLAYSTMLWERSGYATRLKKRWLPYYAEPLRQERLPQVQAACRHHLNQIPLFARRELYFAAFDHLYTSFQLFMQAVFIARSVYPIAYDKWIREQVEEILQLPALYHLLPGILEVRPFTSGIVIKRAEELATLLEIYTT